MLCASSYYLAMCRKEILLILDVLWVGSQIGSEMGSLHSMELSIHCLLTMDPTVSMVCILTIYFLLLSHIDVLIADTMPYRASVQNNVKFDSVSFCFYTSFIKEMSLGVKDEQVCGSLSFRCSFVIFYDFKKSLLKGYQCWFFWGCSWTKRFGVEEIFYENRFKCLQIIWITRAPPSPRRYIVNVVVNKDSKSIIYLSKQNQNLKPHPFPHSRNSGSGHIVSWCV